MIPPRKPLGGVVEGGIYQPSTTLVCTQGLGCTVAQESVLHTQLADSCHPELMSCTLVEEFQDLPTLGEFLDLGLVISPCVGISVSCCSFACVSDIYCSAARFPWLCDQQTKAWIADPKSYKTKKGFRVASVVLINVRSSSLIKWIIITDVHFLRVV